MSLILKLLDNPELNTIDVQEPIPDGIPLFDLSQFVSSRFASPVKRYEYNFTNTIFHTFESFYFENFLKSNASQVSSIQTISKSWTLQASNRKSLKLVDDLKNEFYDLKLNNTEIIHFWDAVNILDLHGVEYIVEVKTFSDDNGRILFGFEIIIFDVNQSQIYFLIHNHFQLYFSIWIEFLNLPPPYHILYLTFFINYFNCKEYENSKKICYIKKEKI